ncbi:DUF2750 domain-containing protein [Vibrio parahaemolyticus]|uniref:DUF2750 domain-containing protein n=1 Tax=Vibrio parahaemolyticus TaxID=670 RepID=UPI0027E50D78|nr:DUF2750 domain-containing protein [Vibrio parahaemolyticus]
MLQDKATSSSNYIRFIDRVIENRTVWGLQHPDGGWAVCNSNQYPDASVYVYWSDRAYASRVSIGMQTSVVLKLSQLMWQKCWYAANKLFKRDSQRVAFLLCVGLSD